MEIHQLRYFVALAQKRHFQQAADAVHISQPTLSQQLQKLEKELGVPLIERSPRQVKLTPDGERFLTYAVTVLETIAKAEADIKDRDDEPKGHVSIGAIPTIGPYVLPGVLKALRTQAPKVSLELHDLTTSVLLQHLKEGRVQLGLLALPINERNVESQSLGHEPFYLAVGARHRLAKKTVVTAADIAQEQLLVLQEGHCFREQSLEYCKVASNSPRIVFQGSSLISVMRLAAIGEGITFVPKMAALPKENPNVKFIPFKAPSPQRELGVIWRASAPLNRTQKLLIDLTSEVVKSILH